MAAKTNSSSQKLKQNRLYVQRIAPAATSNITPRGVYVFIHGLGEHCSRYGELLTTLANDETTQLDVVTGDLSGHGRSDGPRAYCEKFEDWIEDACAFVEYAVSTTKAPPGSPVFVHGQSMGGLIATYVALRNQARFQRGGVVLTSAALDVEWTLTLKFQAQIGALLSMLTPSLEIVPAVRPEDMSKDPEMVKDYVNDPLNTVGNTKARTGQEVLSAFRALVALTPQFEVPLLALHGTSDHCTSISAVERFVANCGSMDKEMKRFEGLYHTMLHEPERQDVLNTIVSWSSRRLTAPNPRL